MNHYGRHIGDWMRDTIHLNATEEGIYTRLCDQYYSREKPLPVDLAMCCKLARANTKEEREAVAFVLKEFFALQEDGYHQARCDRELAAYAAKCERNREVGKKGGRPSNASRDVPRGPKPSGGESGNPAETQTVSQTKPSEAPQETQGKPSENPSHKPLEKTSEANASGAAAPPADPVKVLWDSAMKLLGDTPQMRAMVGKWRKAYGDVVVMEAFCTVERECPTDPVPWMVKTLAARAAKRDSKVIGGVELNAAAASTVDAGQKLLGRMFTEQGASP